MGEPNVSYSSSIPVATSARGMAGRLASNGMTPFAGHVGLHHTNSEELRSAWRRIEDLGFEWILSLIHLYQPQRPY